MLDGTIFEGVEGDEGEASVAAQPVVGRRGRGTIDPREEGLQAGDLVVDGDAKGLEGPRGGVDARPTRVTAERRSHDLREPLRGGYRFQGTGLDKFSSDAGGVAVFAEIPDDAIEFGLAPVVDDIDGGAREGGIEAHVERAGALEGEAAGGVLDLVGGEAEVGEEEVGAEAEAEQRGGEFGEVAPDVEDAEARCGERGAGAGVGEVGGIDVVEDERAVGKEARGEEGGVPAQSGGAIHEGLAWLGIEEGEDLVGEDGDVHRREGR